MATFADCPGAWRDGRSGDAWAYAGRLRTYARWWPAEHEQIRAAVSRAWANGPDAIADAH